LTLIKRGSVGACLLLVAGAGLVAWYGHTARTSRPTIAAPTRNRVFTEASTGTAAAAPTILRPVFHLEQPAPASDKAFGTRPAAQRRLNSPVAVRLAPAASGRRAALHPRHPGEFGRNP
jgi:hypothetical protein